MRDSQFEWDDRKAVTNANEHRVTFELARLAFADPGAVDRLDLDESDEDRMLLTGLVNDVLITVCFVERGRRIRIISARRATRREQSDYNRQAS
ncbi:MAG: BrnT family toxin [Hyphomicrobiaceae bacterium]